MSTHYAVVAAGAGGEATEGCPFGGYKNAEVAPFVPVSLHSQDSCVHAHHCDREQNLCGLQIVATHGLIRSVGWELGRRRVHATIVACGQQRVNPLLPTSRYRRLFP